MRMNVLHIIPQERYWMTITDVRMLEDTKDRMCSR